MLKTEVKTYLTSLDTRLPKFLLNSCNNNIVIAKRLLSAFNNSQSDSHRTNGLMSYVEHGNAHIIDIPFCSHYQYDVMELKE